MTAVSHRPAVRRADARLGDGFVLAALVLGFAAVTLALNAGVVKEALHGRFADPDDAMRLVQVRAWLAGQSWFDMTATRLDPPHGSFMHWSRLVDLPIAALIRLFGLVTDQSHAERLTAVALPTLWLIALFWGVTRIATILVGRAGRLPALLGIWASGAVLVQFAPGRIGHHAPETVALVFAVGSAIAALDPRQARQAFASGILVAVSLALSLETLPFDVVLAATLVGFWLWRGTDLAATLAWFGGGLLVALPPLFLVTVGPARWGTPVCDAYGAAHLGAGLIGGAGAVVLGLAGRRWRGWASRFAAAAAVACLVVAYVAFAYPACLRSPFAAVDPLVRELWLSHVIESQPLPVFVAERPMVGLAIVLPIFFGLIGSLAALASIAPSLPLPPAGRGRGGGQAVRPGAGASGVTPIPNPSPQGGRETRVSTEALCSDIATCIRLALIAILSIAGLALAFWQVRVLATVTPIALCGGVVLVTRLADRLKAAGHGRSARFAPLAILAFASTTWLLVLPDDVRGPTALAAASAKSACLAPAAFTPLRLLPPGSIVAPMDSGSHLLEATPLTVFAAPYHRNDDGNRFAFEVFLAQPEAARRLLASRHVTYVATCPGSAEMERLAMRAPHGLAAMLAAGPMPDFLTRVPLEETPYRVYSVSP